LRVGVADGILVRTDQGDEEAKVETKPAMWALIDALIDVGHALG